MNRTEFVEILAKKVNLSKNTCEKVLKGFQNTLVEVLKKGEEVSLRGFGKFKIVESPARRCVNPITKRFYDVLPRKRAVFKSYKNFKLCVK